MIPPDSTLGLLGGGQLGRMFAAEAVRMGYRVVVVDPDPLAPAAALAVEHLRTDWTDPAIVDALASRVSVVTTEFENVPADVLRALEAHLPVRPGAEAVACCQDRITEKAFLARAGVGTVRWTAINNEAELATAWDAVGAESAILKTARLGYDGKGQVVIPGPPALPTAWQALHRAPCILEERIALAHEVSVMVARDADGATATWPVGENVHVNGILHTTVVPASVDAGIIAAARTAAERIVAALDYVGVMGVECFVTTDGALLVNELAPRPHNSGHWTLDASRTSQFEQQVRIVAGLPLGDTRAESPVAMVNILGDLWQGGAPHFERALAIPGVRLHLYGKHQPRPGRKMGHLTAVAGSPAEALERVTAAWHALSS